MINNYLQSNALSVMVPGRGRIQVLFLKWLFKMIPHLFVASLSIISAAHADDDGVIGTVAGAIADAMDTNDGDDNE